MAEMEFQKHKDLEEINKRIIFLKDSFLGGDNYKKGGYLPQYPREEDDDFAIRLDMATFTNHCASIVEIYNSYLYKEGVARDFGKLQGAEFDAFLADADMMGRSYPKLMREISKHAGAVGFWGVIVDKPEGEAASKGAELEKGIRPYIAVYAPTSIIDYVYSYDNGMLTLEKLVLLEDTGKSDVITYKVWHRDKWELWEVKEIEKKIKAEKVKEGINAIKVIPFVSVKNRDAFHPIIGKSDIADIADLNRRVYILDSGAMNIMQDCALPFLVGPESSLKAMDKISTKIAVPVPEADEGGGEIKWVEPIHSSLPQIAAWRKIAIDDIKELAKTGHGEAENASPESGIALEIRFQQLNALLSEKAENMELAEVKILGFVGLWMKIISDAKIVYPRKFGVRDLLQEIDLTISAKEAIHSRTFKATAEKYLAGRILKDADEDIVETVNKEIDAAIVEPEIDEAGV